MTLYLMLGHKAELVMDHVGDGKKVRRKVTYSVDPVDAIGWGKGKAFKYALVNNKIDMDKAEPCSVSRRHCTRR